MKRIIFTAIFFSAVCLTALAQTSENQFSQIEHISPNQLFLPEEFLINSPFDRFGKLAADDYKARTDNFMIGVNQDPYYEGLISAVLDKRESRNRKIAVLKIMYNHFIFRKYDLSRFTFAVSEMETEQRITLWIVPLGADYPTHAPALEETVIKAEEFNQKINELFPKK